MRKLVLSAVVLLTLGRPARAGDRPDEDAMFGAPASSAPARDDARELSSSAGKDAFATGEAKDNPLQIGGVYYQRWIVSKEQGTSTSESPVSMPLQFDAYMDARPSDRVRGYVQERILHDAARDSSNNPTRGRGASGNAFSSSSGAPTSLSTATTTATNPQTALDQAWLKFDIEHSVFVTAGKQHVKWGTARFWNPTDLLGTQKRDPLLPYDQRLGNTMVKFGVPLASKGGNLYGIVLMDNPQPGSTLGQTGAAFRAETVLGDAEVGADLVARGHAAPVYGADLSAPAGPFDVYAEAALSARAPGPRYRLLGSPTAGADVSSLFSTENSRRDFFQVSGGANYSFGWRPNRLATVGAEYFYNQLGYRNGNIYPVLIFLGAYQPFYVGRHYAAVYLTAEGPDAAKHTSYTLSTLSNLSDGSFLSRLDFSWRFLTYLTFEAYADRHFGSRGGEFRFEVHTPALIFQGAAVAPVDLPPTIYDAGVALRLSF